MGNDLNFDQKLIDGVVCESLAQIADDRGAVLHHLNFKSPTFKGFEEVYISKTLPNKIKAWKKHLKMTQNICVPAGGFKFVLYDDREDSGTKGLVNEFIVDEAQNYKLLAVPPGIWYGFKCISDTVGIIVNLSNLYFDPSEVLRLELSNGIIPYYNWNKNTIGV